MKSILTLLFLLAVLLSCGVYSHELTANDLIEWRVSKVSRQIKEIEIGAAEEKMIARLQKLFVEKPYYDYSRELRIDRVFTNPADATSIYAFFVKDAHDFWVVFVVDSEGALADNFVLSRFDMYQDK